MSSSSSPDIIARGLGAERPAALMQARRRGQGFPWVPLVLTGVFSLSMLMPRVRENPHLLRTFQGVAAFLVAWTVVLWALARKRTEGFPIEFATPLKSHYIQACVQLTIYSYWGYYWRNVYAEAPLILAQFVFLYAFDALLTWSRGRPWRLGFGPLPIILSTNIFIWFKDDWYAYQFLLIAVGALGKEFIKWHRNGKKTHIFNPSAFTLAVFSIVLIVTGTTNLTWGSDIATTVARPPHIYLLMFCLGLTVQYFFSVTLMTLSAFAALFLLGLAWHLGTGTYYFIDSNIPVPIFLGLSFLMTDPSTSPRSNVGKVIFGAAYGLSVFGMFELLERMGVPAHYDKLLPVPILNLSVKLIDRFANSGIVGRFSRWEASFAPRKLNLAYMAGFAALFVPMLATGYVEAPHPGSSIPFWKRAVADGKPNAKRSLVELVTYQASQGSGAAWNELGLFYMDGKLVDRDPKSAAGCFLNACHAGDLVGSANLASQYFQTHVAFTEEDLALAIDRLEKECESRPNGQYAYLVGLAYEKGKGRTADPARATELFQTACKLGNMDACKAVMRLNAVGLSDALR
jgi:hypothetical protein